MPGIGVVVNPHARKNRNGGEARVQRLTQIVGPDGAVRVTESVPAIEDVAREFRDRGTEILAICGGDGSYHCTLTGFRTVYGEAPLPMLLPLRALQGIVGAHEWRRKGVAVKGLEHPIHVHYGVFSPLRGEYLDLVMQAPLPATDLAYDIGTGSGVIAALLAARGVKRIVATDTDPRALACARENLRRQGLDDRVELLETDLFPEGRSPLIVCNPPWLPARPTLPQEQAIYDPDNRMLLDFLAGLRGHLRSGGEGWLIMSDLAEHLGLRAPGFLADAIAAAGLQVLGRLDIRPRHPKAADPDDPLYAARRAELTSLWRLAPQQ